MIRFFAIPLVLTVCFGSFAQEADSVDRDYSDELPRIPALEPEEALDSFEVQPGFRMELVAAEPLVRDPIAMAFDDQGRLFVVEMRGYSERREENIGTVRLLTDEDGDGRFDRATDYVDGLMWPTAVACWDGGIFVGASPDIFYCKDTDGDGRADIRETVFTGFGLSNVQGLLNTFKWGPDNRIHGATSSSGALVTSTANPGGTPLSLRGRDYAIDPLSRAIVATSGGGQHGLTFDEWGHKFVCHNSNHCQYIVYEDRYIARNPYQKAPAANLSVAADGKAADVFRISDVEPWRIVRTRLRVKGLVPGPVEGGGTAAGYFTSATGITVYKGHTWPAAYRGNLIIGDVGSNLIHRKTVEWDGIVPVADRADADTEFVRSKDIWFRPVQFCNGPDGALYVADMYREVIEHPDSLHPVIKQHLDLNSGFDRGRIYRIIPDDFEQPEAVNLGVATSGELAALMSHNNAWHRETAARVLYERQDPDSIGVLAAIAKDSPKPLASASALTVLEGLGALSAEDLLPHFDSEHPGLRAHAVRLSESFADHPDIIDGLARLSRDSDAAVRYQVGWSVGAVQDHRKAEVLVDIALQDGANRWSRLALESSSVGVADIVLSTLMTNKSFLARPAATDVMRMFASVAGATSDYDGLAALFTKLTPDGDGSLVPGILVAARDAGRGALLRRLMQDHDSVRTQLTGMIDQARSAAQDSAMELESRIRAVNSLTMDDYAAAGPVLTSILSPGEPQPLQLASLRALRQYDDERVGLDVIGAWGSLSPAVRTEAIELILSREEWTLDGLRAIENGDIERTAFDSTHVARLKASASDDIQGLASAVFESAASVEREAVVARYRDALNLEGDVTKGRAFFAENCATCHRYGNVGNDVGPNLTGFAQGGAEKILVNVLDPNREVNPQYLSYTVETSDFETYSGVVGSETATSVTLKRANGISDTILRMNIDAMRSDGRSLMPEGWEDSLDLQGMADLIAYLSSAD